MKKKIMTLATVLTFGLTVFAQQVQVLKMLDNPFSIKDDSVTYSNFKWVLEHGTDAQKKTYIPRISGLFENYELTSGLKSLKPLIESNFPSGGMKDSIMTTYTEYEKTAPGQKAPNFSLEDYKHTLHHLTDYKGKILVIDFWATWCGVCIQNLPLYAELASQYENDPRIAFITISIDSRDAFKKWMYSLPRYNLLKLTNLISPADGSDFANTFHVRGVPRYVIIDGEGKIITAKAPTPHDGLKEKIESILKIQK